MTPKTTTRSSFIQKKSGKAMLAGIGVLIIAGAVMGLTMFEFGREIVREGFTQSVSATSPLRMAFPYTMDHESVEHALTIPKGVQGELSWEDDALVFTPTQPLGKGETYEFIIAKTALRSDETPLGENFAFRFVVAGAPAVSARTPGPDAVDVPLHANITVVFDRPMVPLTQVQGDAAKLHWSDWPVAIEPSMKGSWRWLSTYAAQFKPEGGLMPGTFYTVTVPAGIATAGGEKTEKDWTWKFETKRPRVVSTEPEEGNALAGPTTEVTLHFNQEINPGSIANHLKLFKVANGATSSAKTGTGSMPAGQEMQIDAVRYGKKKEGEKMVTDKQSIVVVPSVPYEQRSSYAVVLTSGALGAQGDLGTKENFTLRFSTVGPLTVNSSRFEWGSIALEFSSPIPEADLKNITLEPKPEAWDDATLSVDTWFESRTMTVYPGALAPSTKYTITVGTGFADQYGQKLKEPYTYEFTTPPVTPEVSLANYKGEFGIFEKSKPPVYHINAVNVSTVNVEFAKISLQDFIEFRKQNRYQSEPVIAGKDMYRSWSIKPPKAKKDQWESMPFDIEKRIGASLSPGIYVMLMRAPEYRRSDGVPAVLTQYFAVTNTSLTLKFSGDSALVWATDLQTGKPVPNAKITFHSLQGKAPVQGKTNAEGFFESPISMSDYVLESYEWQPEFWVTADRPNDFAFVSSLWNGGFTPGDFSLWSDFHAASSPPFRMMQQMITDRPVYRPGDTVSFKGIIRLKDWNGQLQLPGKRTMQVTIQDPNGTEVYKKTLPFTEYGGFSGSFPTAEASMTGDYTFVLQLIPESDVRGYPSYVPGFSLLAYRKPEYRIELTPERKDYFNGETLDVDLAGSYYFGAPLADAPVSWRVQLSDYYFNRFTDGWYSFSLEDAWCWWDCERTTEILTEGTGTLDGGGHMRIRFPVSIDDKAVSQIATIEADVTDANNQLVSNRVSVPVHKSGVYVGVRNEEYAVAPGEEATIGIVTVDPQGKALANQSVTLNLYSRVWNTVRKKGVDGEFYYDNESKDTFVGRQTAKTGADGKVRANVELPKGGAYAVFAEVSDSGGRVAKASTSLYSWSDTYFNWPHTNNDRIDVVADKPEYAVGDTAKLLVKSPFQGEGVKALVTMERENVMTKKIVDVTSNALPIEVLITEDFVPNVFVSIMILKPRIGETFDDQGKDTGAPAFRVGYAQLKVETKRKELSVEVQTDKQQYLPGEKVSATVTVKDADGKPAVGEFTFAAVDMSVLALSAFEMPDLVRNFYTEHGLGVMSSQMLTYLIERFKPGSKGGGGGELEDRKRGNFQDTAYWNPAVITDKNGKATLSFTLPDNLTTWQLLALGSTKAGQFGGDEHEIVETKNVIVRPVRPRFAVRGDRIQLGAIVQNYLPDARPFTVSVQGTGFTATAKTSHTVTIKPGEQAKVEFPVTVNDVNELVLNMRAETTGARDEIEEKIPVHIFGTPQSVATTGKTESSVTETVVVPAAKDASSGELQITVSPSLATYLPEGLEYVLTYPYGCAEQITSSFLPHLVLMRLQGFGAFKIVDDARLESNITTSLQKLYRFQKPDGGFGFWEESTRSYAALSAYVLYAMRLAQESGYAVDAVVMKRAGDYLSAVLRSGNKLETSLDLATRTYILYVLAETGRPDANLLNNMYDKRQSLPVFSQVELAMAMQKAGMTNKAETLLGHVLDGAMIDPRGAHVEERHERAFREIMQTNSKTTAQTLQAMIRIDPGNELIPLFIRHLLAVREDEHWDTTQSTVQTIIAFVEYLKSTDELSADYIAGVELNGKMAATQKFDKTNILTRKEITLALDELLRGKENTVKIGVDTNGTLFYDVLLSYFYTGDVIEPAEQGMSILRERGSVDPKVTSVSEVKVGNTYRVTLTMTVPEDRHFVAVESPHPAGFEGIDPALQTTAQTGLPTDLQKQKTAGWWMDMEADESLWRFSHKEFRDDRVFLFADYLPAGIYKYTYLVRATTPGTFRERPARMWEMYFPENFGQTSGQWFTVKP